ncbi:hypothetical protein PYW08_011211 [Mythimna loreyi]|uniref:Uncharacterized protein n=1 Tax=Mythimna loreyi TaxID=667449 RepID=A0ACC2Q2R4_9NEOP|nr:hypothetical protein PYW08_011211 [Mythimna loreyi]
MKKGSIEDRFVLDQEHDDALFKSQEHFKKDVSRQCYGDLYVIGRLWIQTLRKVLVGADLSLIPVVHAAALEPKTPQKPPKMKYKDLPIYESPHYEYKDYLEDQKKCPKANEKILQNYLYPKVKSYRQNWADRIRDFNKDAKELIDDGMKVVKKKKNEWVSYLRSPDNLLVRQAILATGTITGFIAGRGAGVLRRLFGTTVGVLATGAVVFPKETDEQFKEAIDFTHFMAAELLNKICGIEHRIRGCGTKLPPKPPARSPEQKNKCGPEKKEPEKKEPEKKEGEKKDAAGKKDAGKKDAGKKDAGKKDAGKKDAGKKDDAKKDAAKAESAKKDAAKAELAKKEPAKTEPAKANAEKNEPAKK